MSDTDNTLPIPTAEELEQKLQLIKECNYVLVNSISNTEDIQKSKDEIEEQINQHTFNDEKLLKKLQYRVSFETETLMKTLFKLDSLSIVGHIKHTRKLRKDKVKGKNQAYSGDSSDNESVQTSSSSSSDSEDFIDPKFGPHKLRKYRKRIVNRVMRLVDYLDQLSKEITQLKNKYEEQVKNHDIRQNIPTHKSNHIQPKRSNKKISQEFEQPQQPRKIPPSNSADKDYYGKNIPISDGSNSYPPRGKPMNKNSETYQQKHQKKNKNKEQQQNDYYQENDNRRQGGMSFFDQNPLLSPFEFQDPEQENNYDPDEESPNERLNRYQMFQKPPKQNHYRHFQNNPFINRFY